MAKMTSRTLSGFMELLPAPQQQMERIMEVLRKTYSLYGFTPLDTPVIESSEVLLAKAGGETEKQIYRFQKGDSDLSLRFDLTVPLAKYVALHYNELSFPFRRYQIGKVYRGERAQRGRFREFYQADIDIIGDGKLDTLRADSYQDAVNAILMLVANHAERGVVRCYFGSDAEYAELAAEACNEVQQETDLGAYLLDYITYAGTDERGFYELSLSFGYRRTAEEQESIINATSTEAIPDLLRAAAAEGADRLVVRVSYFSTDRAGVEQMVRDVQEEKDGGRDAGMLAAPWQVSFYPDTDEPGIVEILLK